MHNYNFSWTETKYTRITMYNYSISHDFYIKNTNTTIFMTRFHDNNWTLSPQFDYFFHKMSQKLYWLKEYCKYIISMKFGDSIMLISNFGKMPILRNFKSRYLCMFWFAKLKILTNGK